MDIMAGTGIYAIENLRVHRVYVGATNDGFLRRWYTHRMKLRTRTHGNQLLQRDWRAYGPRWFRFVILELIPRDGLMALREQAWIDECRRRDLRPYNVMVPRDSWLHEKHPPIDQRMVFPLSYVAAQLKVTTWTLRRWIKRGDLPAHKVGKHWRVTREALEQFLAGGTPSLEG
jgi:excisionase family DNA binding protein